MFPTDRVSKRTKEQMVNPTVPHVAAIILEGVEDIPVERISKRTEEKIPALQCRGADSQCGKGHPYRARVRVVNDIPQKRSAEHIASVDLPAAASRGGDSSGGPQERISERTEQTDVLEHSERRGATESLEKNEQQVLCQGTQKFRSVDRVPDKVVTKSGVTPVKKQCRCRASRLWSATGGGRKEVAGDSGRNHE